MILVVDVGPALEFDLIRMYCVLDCSPGIQVGYLRGSYHKSIVLITHSDVGVALEL